MPRGKWIPIAIVVVCVGDAVSYGVLPAVRIGWCELFSVRRAAVAVPPPDASPKQVVTAYLHAVAARDDDVVLALSATSFSARYGGTGFGCSYRRLDLIQVGEPHADSSPYARFVLAVPTRYRVETEDGDPEANGERRYDYLVGGTPLPNGGGSSTTGTDERPPGSDHEKS
ncbi:hypothetical protein FHS44_001081 [Streptosporangium saharense]|uniref:Uncharacterized protein n=1 Tax=Streptosporangium saharense TaxID=1706840 RepID=A0A7W7VL39_9ACTN|nr:hypothetical protein [Streptosporangium saharense]